MSKASTLAVGLIAVALAAAGGYYLGHQRAASSGMAATGATPIAAAVPTEAGGKKERKLLYYRNPMGLADTSPEPKKDSMGMDYIAVYADDAADEPTPANQIKISTDKVQKLGVRTEAAQLRVLGKVVRAAGRVEPDEGRVYAIAPKFEGYVERLHVNVTGQVVGRGQPLFEVYSPELVSAQREYAIAVQGVEALKAAGGSAQAGMQQLAQASLQRLKNWDISDEQIKTLTTTGEAKRTLTLRSPVSGIVMEKKAVQGMRFMAGETLYQVTDLSRVWVIADVFEQDIAQLKTGSKAQVRINAYPDKLFNGTITYVYPTLKAETRTVPVRVELANPGLLLKPAMFAEVEMQTGTRAAVLTVPLSAVIDSGTRQVVLVSQAQGRFEPRTVKLGSRTDTYVEVLDGVKDGESVVVSANFLIDAESNLKAALEGFGSKENSAVAFVNNAQTATKSVVSVSHQAHGSVVEVDAKTGLVNISHTPVASLKWPAMTMEFAVANAGLMTALKPGATVDFEFVERGQGEWVITAVKPSSASAK